MVDFPPDNPTTKGVGILFSTSILTHFAIMCIQPTKKIIPKRSPEIPHGSPRKSPGRVRLNRLGSQVRSALGHSWRPRCGRGQCAGGPRPEASEDNSWA